MVAKMAERTIENTAPTLPSAPFSGFACWQLAMVGMVVFLLQFSLVHQHFIPDLSDLHLKAAPHCKASAGTWSPEQPCEMMSWFVHSLRQLAWPDWASQVLTTAPSLHFEAVTVLSQ